MASDIYREEKQFLQVVKGNCKAVLNQTTKKSAIDGVIAVFNAENVKKAPLSHVIHHS